MNTNLFDCILKHALNEALTAQRLAEATPSVEDIPDPTADPAYAQTKSIETDTTITGYDDKDGVEKAVEAEEDKNEATDERGESRLLGIDKRQMNKQFVELCKNPVAALPIKAVTQIISKYGFKLVDEKGNDITFQFKGVDGNYEFDIEEVKTGNHITNSIAILQYHKNDDETYNFNFYFT